MKKFLGILVLGLLVISSPAKAGPIGEGDLTLKPFIVDWFIQYLRAEKGKKPSKFLIINNGENAYYFYCAFSQCAPGGDKKDIHWCELKTKKNCKIFARGRYVKWRNGINPGKGKESKFDSKWSKAEIEAKLTELGFLGGTTSTTTKSEKKKITKKESKIKKKSKKKMSDDVVRQIKELKQLYDDGVLTQEEFTKAKNKLLN